MRWAGGTRLYPGDGSPSRRRRLAGQVDSNSTLTPIPRVTNSVVLFPCRHELGFRTLYGICSQKLHAL
jgi:hypothetical protein